MVAPVNKGTGLSELSYQLDDVSFMPIWPFLISRVGLLAQVKAFDLLGSLCSPIVSPMFSSSDVKRLALKQEA